MIMRRRFPSSDMASRPVFPGSRGTLSRTILSTAFLELLGAAISDPLHNLPGNSIAISIDVLYVVWILLQHLSFRLRGPNLYPADQGSTRHPEDHPYDIGDILGPDLPVPSRFGTVCTPEFGGDASRHDVAHAH